MPSVDIEKILELEAKANPAPWENVYLDIEDSTFVSFNLWSPHGYVLSRIVTAEKADTQFIIAMRNNIVALCDELKAARECIDVFDKNIFFYSDPDRIDKIEIALSRYKEVTKDAEA